MEGRLASAVLLVHAFIGGRRELGDTLTELSALGVNAVDADMAGVTLEESSGRGPRTPFHTDELVVIVDEAQYDADRGPCLHALRAGEAVTIVDTLDDDRWPEFAKEAARHGIRSSLSLPLVVGDRGIGALNFYSRQPNWFHEEAVTVGQLFAGQAAIVAAYYDRAETADHLRRAMESRATIEQAKGVIMATSGCNADEAFAILRGQSQLENRKLRDIATELVQHQQLRRRD
jgi:GAF domain-containing protein